MNPKDFAFLELVVASLNLTAVMRGYTLRSDSYTSSINEKILQQVEATETQIKAVIESQRPVPHVMTRSEQLSEVRSEREKFQQQEPEAGVLPCAQKETKTEELMPTASVRHESIPASAPRPAIRPKQGEPLIEVDALSPDDLVSVGASADLGMPF